MTSQVVALPDAVGGLQLRGPWTLLVPDELIVFTWDREDDFGIDMISAVYDFQHKKDFGVKRPQMFDHKSITYVQK